MHCYAMSAILSLSILYRRAQVKEARFRSWWQKIKQHPSFTVGIVVTIFALIVFTLAISKFGWDWTGFTGGESKITITSTSKGITTATELQPARTLWDWLGLLAALAIPLVVGLGAAWFTAQQGKVSDRENTDNQRETALQAYIDKMSELLLHEKLRDSAKVDEVRKIARVRTLTILPRLDANRKRSALQFLYESGLIDKGKSIVDLNGANLSGADLSETDLSGADLSKANLSKANLHKGIFSKADLSGADLSEAILGFANLSEAYLDKAYLSDAVLSFANLSGADLSGAILFETDLELANLSGANLSEADLYHSNLYSAGLREANLSGADLTEANLSGAMFITEEQLKTTKTLKGATMPDGSKHP
jgi:uncharacterized protein YjbI with pentapeptide repeats